MARKDISVSHSGELEPREETRQNYVRPAVDIFETEDGMTLMADLPGVEKDKVNLDIDRGILTIQAEARSHLKGEPLHREFVPASFYRQFQLPDQIDAEKVAADFKNGVLSVEMPKSEAAKPRRIEIASA